MRIAVTGANGFVGLQVVSRAAASRVDVVGIVRSDGAAHVVSQAGGRPARVPALDADHLAPIFQGTDAVVHLAQIGGERSGMTYEGVNVGGTRSVVEAARRAGVRRVVYFSGLGVARYGQTPRCTNRYFLSKLQAEVALYESGLRVIVFRPSYIVGPGDAFVRLLADDISRGEVELPGDGSYRMQPVAVADAAEAVLAAVERPADFPLAIDLVGPEPIACASFVGRVGIALGKMGRPSEPRLASLPVGEADRRARSGGYRGMLGDELDCMLCDEVGDPRPLEGLLGRFLTPLDEAVARDVRALRKV
jgi:nucleoside-diphosphate-sugar epimerase